VRQNVLLGRLSIAQSIVKQPKILLLDEPFGAPDPGISADMHRLILRLWEEHQMTIFMITQELKEGFELGTRLLVFDKTRLDMQAPEAYGATVTYDIPLHVTTPARVRQWMRRISSELDSIGAAGMIPPVRAWPAVYPPRCRLVSDRRKENQEWQ
jgi:NitT/TauT family transport system ATP-binding protein